MHLYRSTRRTAILAILLACLAYLSNSLLAHDGDYGMLLDQQKAYEGPGWTRSGGGDGGVAGSFTSNGIELLAWIPLSQFPGSNSSAATVEGYVSPAGHEYAVIGLAGGTGFVRVTDPGTPQIVGYIAGPDSLWKDVRVYQHYAYSVSEATAGNGGIQIMDMSQIDSGVVTLVGSFNPGGSTVRTHTMFINNDSGYLYRCGGGSALGVRIYNLSDPVNPAFVGTALTGRYVHECQVVNYTAGPYAGKEILFCFSQTGSGGGAPVGLDILDVTNKSNIIHMSFTTYPDARFCHQGWLSEDRQYVYINDELDEQQLGLPTLTRIINVSNLSAPFFVGAFGNGGTSIDHNLYVKGNFIFESNYRSGLRIWDATNPTAPEEVAWFDTYPSDDNPSFNSLWDNYPFLPSGIVLGSDIENGLFVWHIGLTLLEFAYPQGQPELIDPAGDSFTVEILTIDGEIEPGTPTLHYSTGGPFNAVPLQPVGGDQYLAEFPALACGTLVNYYLSVQTTSGVTVRSPSAAPVQTFATTVGSSSFVGLEDTMESNTGWVVGAPGDTATTGIWVRVDPVGTGAQPEDDHTPAPGVNCWVTGNAAPGAGIGNNDVDGGATTLTSSTMDATAGPVAYVSYWRWYSNNMGGAPNLDTMPVQISNDNGATWIQLELVSENAGTWVFKTFKISDFLAPTNQMKLRFIARDLGDGSIVEAAVDDVLISYVECQPQVPGDVTGDGVVDVSDLLAVIGGWGSCPPPPAACPADANDDGVVNVTDLLMVINNWSS